MNEYLPISEINRLLSLKKRLIGDKDEYRLSFGYGKSKHDLVLVSNSQGNCETFLLSIIRSEKKLLKITFHHMRKADGQFLLRVDLSGAHFNPPEITEALPQKFRPYASRFIKGSHVHYYVEGYESRWALPFEETEFKEWSHITDLEQSLQGIINKISEIINLDSKIIYDPHLSL